MLRRAGVGARRRRGRRSGRPLLHRRADDRHRPLRPASRDARPGVVLLSRRATVVAGAGRRACAARRCFPPAPRRRWRPRGGGGGDRDAGACASLAIASEGTLGAQAKPFKLAVVGDADFASNSFFPYLANADVVLGLTAWLRARTARPTLKPPVEVLPTRGDDQRADADRVLRLRGAAARPVCADRAGRVVAAPTMSPVRSATAGGGPVRSR